MKKTIMEMLEIIGPDRRMDVKGGNFWEKPLNPLPEKCSKCGMPDLDFLPERYVLKVGTNAPSEMLMAEMGNFFVRERTRKILELVVPGQCSFQLTYQQKTGELTDWHLAVPLHLTRTGDVKAPIPRCPRCAEAMTCHPGTQGESVAGWTGQSPWDILKSVNWGSREILDNNQEIHDWSANVIPYPDSVYQAFLEASPRHKWHRDFFGRNLYFSVRLAILLMKRLKLRAICPLMGDFGTPTTDDEAWIRQKVTALRTAGLTESSGCNLADTAKWFASYMAKQKPKKTFDVSAIEIGLGIQLPQSYKAFCQHVGERRFKDIDDSEGFVAIIRRPSEDDVAGAMASAVEAVRGGDDSAPRMAYPFAQTEHGDEFVFDVGVDHEDAPVYLFQHESTIYEEYAPNFASCLRRWVDG